MGRDLYNVAVDSEVLEIRHQMYGSIEQEHVRFRLNFTPLSPLPEERPEVEPIPPTPGDGLMTWDAGEYCLLFIGIP